MAEYMTPAEVEASAALGNRIALKIGVTGINATLRHVMERDGFHDAKLIAVKVLGLCYSDAADLCRRLQNSKANDIVSPTWGM